MLMPELPADAPGSSCVRPDDLAVDLQLILANALDVREIRSDLQGLRVINEHLLARRGVFNGFAVSTCWFNRCADYFFERPLDMCPESLLRGGREEPLEVALCNDVYRLS